MKPTHLLVLKLDSNGDFLAINTQDLKTVTINVEKETAVIVTSSAKTNLTCMTKSRLERFSKELNSRYNVLHLPSMKCETTKKDNTVFLVERDHGRVYIWPKALFTVTKRDQVLRLAACGGMDLVIDDPDNNVTAEDLVKFDGLVKI
jgi:hypothetical protein